MKPLIALFAFLLPTTVIADTYIEYKHKRSLDVSGKTSHFVRVGHKFENNFYNPSVSNYLSLKVGIICLNFLSFKFSKKIRK